MEPDGTSVNASRNNAKKIDPEGQANFNQTYPVTLYLYYTLPTGTSLCQFDEEHVLYTKSHYDWATPDIQRANFAVVAENINLARSVATGIQGESGGRFTRIWSDRIIDGTDLSRLRVPGKLLNNLLSRCGP